MVRLFCGLARYRSYCNIPFVLTAAGFPLIILFIAPTLYGCASHFPPFFLSAPCAFLFLVAAFALVPSLSIPLNTRAARSVLRYHAVIPCLAGTAAVRYSKRNSKTGRDPLGSYFQSAYIPFKMNSFSFFFLLPPPKYFLPASVREPRTSYEANGKRKMKLAEGRGGRFAGVHRC